MNYHVEVCIDNLESLHNAIAGGATRIELCSSLALGGLTPSFGFMKKAAEISSIPVYAMIRPRQGDFLYSQEDIDAMLFDIESAAEAGLQGVVFGVLNSSGNIDMTQATQLADRAKLYGLGITFHRAIDQCQDYPTAIEQIANIGCERILTSGQASTVCEGTAVLKHMVELADGRFSIMAGAGLNADNVAEVIHQTGVREVHLSGKSTRPSKMNLKADSAKMGSQDLDDFIIPITSIKAIANVVDTLNTEA